MFRLDDPVRVEIARVRSALKTKSSNLLLKVNQMNRQISTRKAAPPPPYKSTKNKKMKERTTDEVTELAHKILRSKEQFQFQLMVANTNTTSSAQRSPTRERPCRPMLPRRTSCPLGRRDVNNDLDEKTLQRRRDRKSARAESQTIQIISCGTEMLVRRNTLLTLSQRRFLRTLRLLLIEQEIQLNQQNLCVVLYQHFTIETLLRESDVQESLAAMLKCVGLKLFDLHHFVRLFSGNDDKM